MRKTKIHTWTEEWQKLYIQGRDMDIFNSELVAIFHIGSKSIPSIG